MFAGSRTAATAEGPSRRGENPIIQLVGFRLDNEDYAIAITKIQEIILMKPITRLPQVPPSIEGLINLRGTVIPLVNLRKRFGLVNDKERTLKEIGDEYRLSRERVRQLQEQALGKMRRAMSKRESV